MPDEQNRLRAPAEVQPPRVGCIRPGVLIPLSPDECIESGHIVRKPASDFRAPIEVHPPNQPRQLFTAPNVSRNALLAIARQPRCPRWLRQIIRALPLCPHSTVTLPFKGTQSCIECGASRANWNWSGGQKYICRWRRPLWRFNAEAHYRTEQMHVRDSIARFHAREDCKAATR
jgi:hypothetical protein